MGWNVCAAVETIVRDAILSAMDSLFIPKMELAIRLADASSTRNASSAVLNPDQKDFSGDKNDRQMTASSKYNSNTNLDRIDETRGNITVEAGDLLVREINFYHRETHFHHRRNLFDVH